MKKILFITVLAAIFAACESNEPKAFSIKDTDMISIRPAASDANALQKVKADDAHLSALEIVKQTTIINTPDGGRSFASEQRDTLSTPPKLLMWATDVITLDGELQTWWIEATDVVFERYSTDSGDPNNVIDTIAYIPNSVLRAAETAIRAAYEAKDIEECYRLFNEAYTFKPITGAEWRALKANGQN
jgi:hypothetical protein